MKMISITILSLIMICAPVVIPLALFLGEVGGAISIIIIFPSFFFSLTAALDITSHRF